MNRDNIDLNVLYTTEELKEILKTATISKYDNSYLGVPVYQNMSYKSGSIFPFYQYW